jgi:hypothetical protein
MLWDQDLRFGREEWEFRGERAIEWWTVERKMGGMR